jgi:hypothetical protein
MTRNSKLTTWGLLATLAATTLTPVLASPASRQKNKNDWRNLAAVGAAIAGYGLLKGNQTATILGAAGGAYAANRYETDRKHQSQDSGHNNYYNNGGGNNNRRYYRRGGGQPSFSNNNGSWYNNDNRDQYRAGDENQQGNNRFQENEHHDNGRHRGRNRHQDGDGERD